MKAYYRILSVVFILSFLSGCATVTPLGRAAKRGDIKEVEELLNKGANVNAVIIPGLSPLHEAVFNDAPLDIVRLLLDKGADVNKKSCGDGWSGDSCGMPIHLAVFKGNINMVKLLLDYGADVSLVNFNNKTPLQMARGKGYTDIARMLKKKECECEKAITSQECASILASSYEQLGQFEKAIAAQKKLIEFLPNDSGAFAKLAGLYYENKQYDEAITAGKRAIELKSDNTVAYNNLGAAYGMKKQYSEARKALQKAIEIDPKLSYAYGWMGRFLMEQNAYNEAAEVYKKGIEAAPSFNLYPSLATAFYKMGRYDDAIAAATRAIELQTHSGVVGIGIANKDDYPVVTVVMATGPAQKADIQVGDRILKIDGKSTKGWTEEKVSQNIRGTAGTQVVLTVERKGTKKPIDKTITRETIFPKEAALSFGLRSFAYRNKGSLEAALKDAEKAYSLDSANDWAQVSLGASYLDKGKNDEAVKLLSQVKDSPTARILEATAYAKQGKTTEAVDIYLSIPEEEISSKNIPLMNDRMALLQTFKPIVKEYRDKARSFQSQGQYKEALSELSEALKTADDTEVQDIQENIFGMIRRNPLLSEMPEDARKYALRSEMLTTEGNFEQAATELKKAIQIAPYAARLYYNSAIINAELKKYPEAIRYMNIYLKAVPDALDARAAKDEIIKWEFMMEKEK